MRKTRLHLELHIIYRTFLIGLVPISVFLAGCDGMNGCAGDGPLFPNKDKIQSAIQVRVTESGFETIGETVTPIIKEALPPELNSCLPGDSGTALFIDWRYCNMETCTNGETGCDINISVEDVLFNAIEPNTVRASVVLDELALRFDVGADPIVDCDIAIDGPNVPINLDIILTTPEPQRNLGVIVTDAVYDLTDITISLEGNDGVLSPLCEVLDGAFNLPFLRDLVLGLLGDVVDNVLIVGLQGVINEFICLKCDGEEDPLCTSQGGSCFLGSCIREDLTCVTRPLGVEGETDLGEMLSGVTPNLEAPLSYFLNPGSYAEVSDSGLSLGVITGTGAQLNRCIPPAIPPNIEEPPRTVVLESNQTPNGDKFDIGLAISQTMLDQALWSVYTSGLTCLSITSATVEQLNSTTLQILLPNLGNLTRGPAPIAITLAPQQPPQGIIGENRLSPPDANGERILEDPLLTVDWPNLWLDFHAFMDDRWTRIFSLKVHLILPLGISFDANGGIIPLLGDLNTALTDVEVANDEILFDDTSRITTLLPALTGPLIGTALSSLSEPIALPDILGFALAPQEDSITGISEGDEDFIALFANLVRIEMVDMMDQETDGQMTNEMNGQRPENRLNHRGLNQKIAHKIQSLQNSELTSNIYADSMQIVQAYPIDTQAHIKTIQAPPLESWIHNGVLPWYAQKNKYPSVTLDLAASDDFSRHHAIEYEYSWRVNQQTWKPFTTAQTLTIADPAFMLPGTHQIEVRARISGDHFSLDPTPVELSVSLYDLPISTERDDVKPLNLIGRADPNALPTDNNSGCACDQNLNQSPPTFWQKFTWLCILFGFTCLRPRLWVDKRYTLRQLKSLLTLLVLSLSFLGGLGCDDETKPRQDSNECNPLDCGNNQVCLEGSCTTVTCVEDSTCEELNCEGPEVAECGSESLCECPSAPLCPEGCGENEYCCYQSNSCETPQPPCLDMAEALNCPAGFEPGATTRGMVNPQSCMLEDEVCECIESTPLEVNSIGRFSDLAYDQTRGIAWVSAYAEDYGDLVVGRVGDENNITWYWVDGVPIDAPVVAAPSGPRGGVEAAGDDVGQYTSLAVGGDGSLHIAYLDVTHRSLKYALGLNDGDGNMTWTITTLDMGGQVDMMSDQRDDDAGAGWWTDITVDSLGYPHVIYRALQSDEDADRPLTSTVRWLKSNTDHPSTRSDWGMTQILHSSTPPASLMSLGYPEGTGLFNSITSTPNGLAAAWYDRSAGNMMSTQLTADSYTPPEIVAGWGHETLRGDYGANVNVQADETGDLHFCYQDGATDSLRYLSPTLERDEWVDDGIRLAVDGREHALHVVGEDCSLSFDEQGRVVIVYQDATGHELLIARRDDSGSWLRVTVRGPTLGESQSSSGFYAQAISLGEVLLISHYIYDHQVDPPRQFLEVLQVPTP